MQVDFISNNLFSKLSIKCFSLWLACSNCILTSNWSYCSAALRNISAFVPNFRFVLHDWISVQSIPNPWSRYFVFRMKLLCVIYIDIAVCLYLSMYLFEKQRLCFVHFLVSTFDSHKHYDRNSVTRCMCSRLIAAPWFPHIWWIFCPVFSRYVNISWS